MTDCSDARITVAPSVQCRIVDNQAVLLDPHTDLHLRLNSSSMRMWTALSNTGSIQKAYETLLEGHNEPDRLQMDLSEFLGDLWLHNLIHVEVAGSPEEEFRAVPEAVAVY